MKSISPFNLGIYSIILMILLLMTLGMSSCDATKQQTKHFKKFIKWGGKINCDQDTLWQYDTTYLEGAMKIDSFPIPCDCGEPVIGYTNKQVRMMLRHQKDSMDYLLKLEKIRARKLSDSLSKIVQLSKEKTKQDKEDTKQVKQETKQVTEVENTKQSENLRWIPALILLLLTLMGLYLLINRIKKF